jgi:hypothetical protein
VPAPEALEPVPAVVLPPVVELPVVVPEDVPVASEVVLPVVLLPFVPPPDSPHVLPPLVPPPGVVPSPPLGGVAAAVVKVVSGP